MKHTKGTWEIKTPNNSTQVIESEYGVICSISEPFGTEEAEANAKLIAAAPELLNALVDLMLWVKHMEPNEKTGYAFDNAQEIIKKAIG